MKFRLINDNTQWILQKYQEGGSVVAKGKYKGQIKQAKWKDVGYHLWLEHAVESAYREMLKVKIQDPIELQNTDSILKAIDAAYDGIRHMLADKNKEVTI